MIAEQQIDEIKSRLNIVEIVSKYVPLKKRGRNYLGLCPFHEEKTPSFTVSPEKQICHCFGCGEGGNVFNFLMKIERITFREAVKLAAETAGLTIDQEELFKISGKSAKKQYKQEYQLLSMANEYFKNNLRKAWQENAAIKEYLASRKITAESIASFELGLALNEWEGLKSYLETKGHADVPFLLEAGLLTKSDLGKVYDKFRARLIFPIMDAQGRVIAFGGRILPAEGDSSPAKYLNSNESKLFNKSKVLYGWFQAIPAIRHQKKVIIVEGYLDVISCFQAGFKNVVASMGTAFTIEQARFIKRFVDEVLFAMDMDTAGRKSVLRAIEICKYINLKASIIEYEAKDPDDLLGKENGQELFKQHLTNSLSATRYILQYLYKNFPPNNVEEKEALLQKMVNELKEISSPLIQDQYIKETANLLKIPKEMVEILTKEIHIYKRNYAMLHLTHSPAVKKQLKAERILIKAGLLNQENRHKILSLVVTEHFSEDIGKKSFQFLKIGGRADAIEDDATPEVQKYIRELMLDEAPRDMPERVVDDCIQVVLKNAKNEKIKQLKEILHTAETKGSGDRAQEILREINILQQPAK